MHTKTIFTSKYEVPKYTYMFVQNYKVPTLNRVWIFVNNFNGAEDLAITF